MPQFSRGRIKVLNVLTLEFNYSENEYNHGTEAQTKFVIPGRGGEDEVEADVVRVLSEQGAVRAGGGVPRGAV